MARLRRERAIVQLADVVPRNGRVALGDGAGVPLELWPDLLDLLDARPDVSLLMGWWLSAPPSADRLDSDRARTLVSGLGMRRCIDDERVQFIPARLGAVPSVLHGALRPDVLVASLVAVPGGFAFSTEVSWQRAAIRAGARVVAAGRTGPVLDLHEPLPAESVQVLLESESAPQCLATAAPTDIQLAIASRVAALIPEGARVQLGPGAIGAAVYGSIARPVYVDTGMLSDAVVGLDQRGLLLGQPVAAYAAGTPLLYDWACTGRARVCGIEHSHHPGRLLEGPGLVAINTGLEIDLDGQVGAEVAKGSWVGGIGGQPDFAAAAATSPAGLSVVVLPSLIGGRPTLVERLGGPVTTPSHDVEVVVTEHGVADLRGLSRAERRTALARLWGSAAP